MTTPNHEDPRIPLPDEELSQTRAEGELSLFEARRYEDDTRRRWDSRIFSIKLDYLNTISKLGLWSVRAVGVALLLVLLYMIYLVVVHYTAPGIGWLAAGELTRLENVYGRATNVAAPVMLMTNAWIIWWMSRTRRGG